MVFMKTESTNQKETIDHQNDSAFSSFLVIFDFFEGHIRNLRVFYPKYVQYELEQTYLTEISFIII